MCALLSPENLPAEAVKGLITIERNLVFYTHDDDARLHVLGCRADDDDDDVELHVLGCRADDDDDDVELHVLGCRADDDDDDVELHVLGCRADDDDDDVELHVLGCRVDILGTNCDQYLSTVQCCFTSTETVRLIRAGCPGRPPRLSHSS